MPFEISLHLSAIVSAAFICFAMLALWFSDALFGPLLDRLRTAHSSPRRITPMMVQGLFILLFCTVMEIVVDSIGAVGMSQGIYVGIAVWLMISLIHLSVSLQFTVRSLASKAIYSGYFLVASVLSATLLSMWR